jgi:hypothetical protein
VREIMSIFHLLWIIPLTGMIGFLFGSAMRISSETDKKTEELLNK